MPFSDEPTLDEVRADIAALESLIEETERKLAHMRKDLYVYRSYYDANFGGL